MSKIVVTLNFISNDVDYKIIQKYLSITNIFRVNMAKCNSFEEMVNVTERIRKLKAKLKVPTRFIYDIPYPKKKLGYY